ncbi:MAG: hypothetical protein ACK5L3_10420 [Oscillospiraceae bacterium]
MKNLSHSTRARWAAGLLYGLLFVYQLVFLRQAMLTISLLKLPAAWQLEIFTLLPIAAACVALFSGTCALGEKARRGAVAASALYIVMELVFYKAQADIVAFSLFKWNEAASKNPVLQYAIIIVRMLLVIFAAYFVTDSNEKPQPAQGSAEQEKDPPAQGGAEAPAEE